MFFYRDNYLNTKERPAFWANSPVGDIPLELYMSTVGHIGYIDEYMSTYRIEAKGSWTNNTGLSLRALDLGRSLSRMLKEFDEYSNYKFHKYVIVGRILYLLRSYRDVLLLLKYKMMSPFKY